MFIVSPPCFMWWQNECFSYDVLTIGDIYSYVGMSSSSFSRLVCFRHSGSNLVFLSFRLCYNVWTGLFPSRYYHLHNCSSRAIVFFFSSLHVGPFHTNLMFVFIWYSYLWHPLNCMSCFLTCHIHFILWFYNKFHNHLALWQERCGNKAWFFYYCTLWTSKR